MAEEQTFTPTQKMAAAAKRGLRLREKIGRGGTDVGVARANQLANREPVSEADAKAMKSYFARHAVDKDTRTHEWGSDKDPSAGWIAWLLWGGDEGRKWAEAKARSLES